MKTKSVNVNFFARNYERNKIDFKYHIYAYTQYVCVINSCERYYKFSLDVYNI